MAHLNEKAADETVRSSNDNTITPPSEFVEGAPPKGKPWMYKKLKLGPITIPAYASPEFQIVFLAMVCFLCPGMFNAVNGLGAGGQVDPKDINKANTALYSTFAVVGFFAGSIANTIGLRLTLGIGGFGYFLYVASILSYNHNGNVGFLVFAGALLGLCAGMLWCAQGAVMMSYPPEKSKGKYVSWFWMIFNLGAVIGALVPLGQNIHSEGKAVNDGTYIAFMILMAIGFVISMFLCNPHFVERADGSHVIMMKNPTWKTEIVGLFQTFKTDPYIILLFPAFFASNWFYTYHFQSVNRPVFNIRTRALNNVLYWSMQIIGAFVTGYALDYSRIGRKTRAKAALAYLMIITMAIWGGGYAFQRTYTRSETDATPGHPATYDLIDWTDGGRYIGPMFLYMAYGFYDAAWQTTMYWFMGALTNNARKLANFAGFYKGIQSAGGAVAAAFDTTEPAFMTELASNWGLLAGSLVVAAPVIWFRIQDHTSVEEDLKFTDESVADVAPTGALVGPEGNMLEKKEMMH